MADYVYIKSRYGFTIEYDCSNNMIYIGHGTAYSSIDDYKWILSFIEQRIKQLEPLLKQICKVIGGG